MRQKLLILLCALMTTATALAYDFTYDYNGTTLYFNITADNTCAVTYRGKNYNSYSGNVEIPTSVNYQGNEYMVTSIGDEAFYGCSGLTEVTISNSVTLIGDYAFWYCQGLKTVTLADGDENLEFGDYVFSNAPIETLYVGRNFYRPTNDYYPDPFYNKRTIKKLTISNSVTSICVCAFMYCDGLEELIIPVSVTSIGQYAFAGCNGLKKVAFPQTLEYDFNGGPIPYNPDDYCLEDGVITNADKTQLLFVSIFKEGEYTIPETVTEIGLYALADCDKLTCVNAQPQIAPSTYKYSFGTIYNTASLNIPEGSLSSYLSTDYWYLFNNVSIDGVSASANDGIFNYIVDPVAKEATLVSVLDQTKTSYNVNARVKLKVGDNETSEFYKITAIGKAAFQGMTNQFSITFGNNLKKIDAEAFAGCKYLQTVTFPAALESIGELAFWGCYTLQTVTLNEGLINLGASAFAFCWSLNNITIPESVTVINQTTFSDCRSLASINLHNQITSIEQAAFAGCTSLTQITIPEKVTDIKSSTFYNCPALTSITLHDGIKTIGDEAFSECSSLSNITLPENISELGVRCFFGCTSLESISLNESLCKIGYEAFAYCSSLKEIALPENISRIDDYTFYGCTALKSITFGDRLSEIGIRAFANCPNLTSFNLSTIDTVHEGAFYNTGLTDVVIPTTVESVGSQAFANCQGLTHFTIEEGVTTLNTYSDVLANSPVTDLYIGRNCTEWTASLLCLENLSIGNGVTNIREESFLDCYTLKTLRLGSALTAIPAYAFTGCTQLTDIVVPGTVTTIGECAFEDCSDVSNIAIGYGVAEIGSNAFNGINNAQSVAVAALTPPEADNSAFSNYDKPLYVPANSIDDYWDADCWYNFADKNDPLELVEITQIQINGSDQLSAFEKGQTIQLTTTITPSNATLPYIFWRSSNPELATVDVNGVVTVRNVTDSTQDVEITAETMYANGPTATVTITLDGSHKELALIDGVDYVYSSAVSDCDVTYHRDFTSTNWQALYVPYNMAYEDWADYAYVATPKEVTEESGELVIVWQHVTSGELIAGHPYIIQPFETGEVTFCSEGCDVMPADVKDDVVYTFSGTTLTLSGTYVEKDDMASSGAYALAGGVFRPAESDAVTLKPYRIFLTMDGSKKNVRNRIDGEETYLDGITIDRQDNDDYYDLQGRKISSPHNGVFIKNGQKILVK